MKVAAGHLGRVLVIRLDEGDVLHECVERAAKDAGMHRAAVLALGGADRGSRLVVGPEDGDARSIVPVHTELTGASEMAAVGTIFPDEEGEPSLHMHGTFGRGERAVTGCVRAGVNAWLIQEVVVIELLGLESVRITDKETGFKLLVP